MVESKNGAHQRRRALAFDSLAPSRAGVVGTRVAIAGDGPAGVVALRYRGLGPFTQRSPRTWRLDACGGTGATLKVDPADVEALLRTRVFSRA